jgi:hypothetical protein
MTWSAVTAGASGYFYAVASAGTGNYRFIHSSDSGATWTGVDLGAYLGPMEWRSIHYSTSRLVAVAANAGNFNPGFASMRSYGANGVLGTSWTGSTIGGNGSVANDAGWKVVVHATNVLVGSEDNPVIALANSDVVTTPVAWSRSGR